jgi:hypothetical protein
MRRILLAAAPILMIAVAPTSSQADADGAAFGVGTGLVVAGPVGAVVGEVVSAVGGTPWHYTVRYDLPSTRSLMICRAAAMSFELLSSLKFQRPSR